MLEYWQRKQLKDGCVTSRNIPQDAYRALFENSMDAVFLTISDCSIVAANPAACAMFGMTETELCLAGRDGLVDTADPGLSVFLEERKRAGKARGELRYKRKNNSTFVGDVSSVILDDGQRVFVIIHDITEQKQVEEALRRSEERYQLVNRATNDVIWDWDLTTDTIYRGGAMQIAFGYAEGEFPPTLDTWSDHLHSEDRDRVVKGLFAAIRGEDEHWSDEYRFRRKDGTYSNFLDRGFILRDSSGKALRMIGSMLDISDRKRLEAERDRLASQLEAIIEFLPAGVVLYGPEGEILLLNPTAEILCGYPPDVKQLSLAERHTPGSKITPDGEPIPFERLPIARALKGEIVQTETIGNTHPDGRFLWLSVSASPIYSTDGQLQGAVMACLDISRLLQLQEEKESYLHTITHDLRTPLTVIQGHAQMLRPEIEEADLGEISLINIDAIETACTQMTGMIKDLSAVARLESGKLELQREVIDLVRFVADYLRRTQVAMDVSRVFAEIPSGLPPVWADPRSVERCLGNLLSNALKYSNEDAPVRLRARQEENLVVFTVEDQGPGIPPEDLSHIFDRFFRSGDAKKKGLGLGLFITRSLVEAHGGHIWVESEPGHGSKFQFSLPIAGPDISVKEESELP
jgi:PAS domain S-box-containing protein